MQYFRPGGSYYAGDCMPFYHDGTFHLYYLLDENHHRGNRGLGGHQWAHASTTDLVHWSHHPLALAIEQDWEASICTGSVFHHGDTFYAFYATRLPDRTEHLSLAVSDDGLRFVKTEPNPFASPQPPYRQGPFRDPTVFRDPADGLFHMLVTAELEDYPLAGRGGCLAHFTSTDLRTWHDDGPFLVPGYTGHQPECADYFEWHGWYYLIFSDVGVAHYRMARRPFGPWLRPRNDVFDGPKASVLKTAEFLGDRRLGVAFVTSPPPDAWAGNVLFRELVQYEDGTLGIRFPPEMMPHGGPAIPLEFSGLTPGWHQDGARVELSASEGLAVAGLGPLPPNLRLTVEVRPQTATAEFGLCLRGAERFAEGNLLRFEPYRARVSWSSPASAAVSAFRSTGVEDQERAAIRAVSRLDRPFRLELIALDDIIDVCVDGRRTLVNRVAAPSGDYLYLYCQNGQVTFDGLDLRPL